MRAVVSRVGTAAVTVDGEVVGEIGRGLLALVGVGREDDAERARTLARKVHELRVFPTADGARSAGDLGLPVLVVSQFTLYADTRKGRRPTWNGAAAAEVAQPLVERVVQTLRSLGVRVQTGRFGAQMQLALINDGPVTLIVDL